MKANRFMTRILDAFILPIMNNFYKLYVDASLKGWGYVLFEVTIQNCELSYVLGNGKLVALGCGKFNEKYTNNEAEYLALIEGLQYCRDKGLQLVDVYSDSELVIKQLNGKYGIKSENLIPYLARAEEICKWPLVAHLNHIKGIDNPADKLTRLDDVIGGMKFEREIESGDSTDQ